MITDILICENDFAHFKYERLQKILFITIKAAIPSDKEWTVFKDILRNYYDVAIKTDQKFSMMIDLRNLTLLPWDKYNDYKNFFNELREKTKICIHGTALIVELTFVRAALNAFFLIYNAERPVSFVDTIDNGIDFLKDI